ncbi:uncharacterized protein LOC127867323 [Dreissena polymorpha]|uniref:Uncharacterized protein n=1 Tax=Dreissena polymorpha TaxID=45954 RepID=A0A9D4S422_DREPO|nr:uncharacterized protein LOC127867323 [Dreissena polymorpha]KAH3890926.1 hypothetical protein DPMN_015015 [Dreissena polymorpha]
MSRLQPLIVSLAVAVFSSTHAFRIEGRSRPVLHGDLGDDLSFDLCSDRGLNAVEYMRTNNGSDNVSLTVDMHHQGFEEYYGNIGAGFGITKANQSGVIMVHAWREGADGGLVTMAIDLHNGTILRKKIHKDFAQIMCAGDNLVHTLGNRGIGDTVVSFLRFGCSWFLDISPIALECSTLTSGTCVGIAAALEAAIPIPGDSLLWFPICRNAMKILCGSIGMADPSSLQVYFNIVL